MPKQDNGGPAFPKAGTISSDGAKIDAPEEGISYLDYAAIKAMQGLLANQDTEASRLDPSALATLSYAIATAMLAEKRRREEG